MEGKNPQAADRALGGQLLKANRDSTAGKPSSFILHKLSFSPNPNVPEVYDWVQKGVGHERAMDI